MGHIDGIPIITETFTGTKKENEKLKKRKQKVKKEKRGGNIWEIWLGIFIFNLNKYFWESYPFPSFNKLMVLINNLTAKSNNTETNYD